jgi:hypothetical protein
MNDSGLKRTHNSWPGADQLKHVFRDEFSVEAAIASLATPSQSIFDLEELIRSKLV